MVITACSGIKNVPRRERGEEAHYIEYVFDRMLSNLGLYSLPVFGCVGGP